MKKVVVSPVLVTVLVLFLFAGCAVKKPLMVNSNPAGAFVSISNGEGSVQTGVTPASFKLSPKKTYQVNVNKTGYEPLQLSAEAHTHEVLTIKNAASTALAFIVPLAGVPWVVTRAVTGDYKSFDKLEVNLAPLSSTSMVVTQNAPPLKTLIQEKPVVQIQEPTAPASTSSVYSNARVQIIDMRGAHVSQGTSHTTECKHDTVDCPHFRVISPGTR